ncbi:putative ribonuclease H-like domain-containing protein [Tanacetum coccineum]
MNQFCEMKGIKREFSVARTPQQNGVAERKNRTLIEAARTMLADSLLPTTFWAEAINTACYVQNRVLITKPHNKTPYELLIGRSPNLNVMRPFGCPVTILNTLDHLGKFEGKDDEGFLGVVQCIEINVNAGQVGQEKASDHEYILLPLMPSNSPLSSSTQSSDDKDVKPSGEVEKKDAEDSENKDSKVPKDNVVDENIVYGCVDDPNMPNLEEIVYSDDDEDNDAKAYMNNLNIFMPVSPILTTRLHKDHPLEDIIRDIHSSPQTRRMTKSVTEHVEPKKRHWDKLEFYRTRKVREVLLLETKQGWLHRVTLSEEGIEYDAVFDLVARIEAIRMFLAYASFINFVVYHMDVKSAFLYGKIEEEIYIYQPPGFEDPKFPDRVYKIENALYGLHQAPKVGNLQLEIIHKGWLKWNATTVEDGIEVKTGNSKVNAVGHYLVLLSIT